MSAADSGQDPFDRVAEAFLAQYRAGGRPSVSEYAQRYPELAVQIRDLFPALVELEQVHPGAPAAPPAAERRDVPRQLGDFRILREVGRGGMGIVYEAVQESLGRHIALKVLPVQAVRDPLCLQRFRREARAVARLHHTNIVPVHEVGEWQGVHYYAMQFIQGQALDQVLQEVRRLRGPPEAAPPAPARPATVCLARGLLTGQFREGEADACGEPLTEGPVPRLSQPCHAPSPPAAVSGTTAPIGAASASDFSTQDDYRYYRSVAGLGLQAAEALAYAHSQRVLHRDVKPSNLLLDEQGRVWLTDFGLAKDERGDDVTGTGDLVGTLRYMAPERFRGQTDARCDVYSLGLTLYELLTLRAAFDGTDRNELVRRVTQEEPPRPRQLDRRIPRDLETVVFKATAREPVRRQTWAQKVQKWSRRNRPVVWSGMAVARLPVDIFVQIGLLVLVRLASKNAILIVEYARQLHQEGKGLHEAAREASAIRFRPIVMTSLAFILGVLPLVLATGAGAEMRQSLGTAVFSGMIGVTLFGVVLTPVFFFVVLWLGEHRRARPLAHAPLADGGPDGRPPGVAVAPAPRDGAQKGDVAR
jgi:serine/threonine protein kinase